jgi:hypothetical protein
MQYLIYVVDIGSPKQAWLGRACRVTSTPSLLVAPIFLAWRPGSRVTSVRAHQSRSGSRLRLSFQSPLTLRCSGRHGWARCGRALPGRGRMVPEPTSPRWRSKSVRGCCERAGASAGNETRSDASADHARSSSLGPDRQGRGQRAGNRHGGCTSLGSFRIPPRTRACTQRAWRE